MCLFLPNSRKRKSAMEEIMEVSIDKVPSSSPELNNTENHKINSLLSDGENQEGEDE